MASDLERPTEREIEEELMRELGLDEATEAPEIGREDVLSGGASRYSDIWDHVTEKLRDKITRRAFTTWIAPLYLSSIEEDKVVITCPTSFFIEWVGDNYRSLLEITIEKVLGREMDVELVSEGEDEG